MSSLLLPQFCVGTGRRHEIGYFGSTPNALSPAEEIVVKWAAELFKPPPEFEPIITWIPLSHDRTVLMMTFMDMGELDTRIFPFTHGVILGAEALQLIRANPFVLVRANLLSRRPHSQRSETLESLQVPANAISQTAHMEEMPELTPCSQRVLLALLSDVTSRLHLLSNHALVEALLMLPVCYRQTVSFTTYGLNQSDRSYSILAQRLQQESYNVPSILGTAGIRLRITSGPSLQCDELGATDCDAEAYLKAYLTVRKKQWDITQFFNYIENLYADLPPHRASAEALYLLELAEYLEQGRYGSAAKTYELLHDGDKALSATIKLVEKTLRSLDEEENIDELALLYRLINHLVTDSVIVKEPSVEVLSIACDVSVALYPDRLFELLTVLFAAGEDNGAASLISSIQKDLLTQRLQLLKTLPEFSLPSSQEALYWIISCRDYTTQYEETPGIINKILAVLKVSGPHRTELGRILDDIGQVQPPSEQVFAARCVLLKKSGDQGREPSSVLPFLEPVITDVLRRKWDSDRWATHFIYAPIIPGEYHDRLALLLQGLGKVVSNSDVIRDAADCIWKLVQLTAKRSPFGWKCAANIFADTSRQLGEEKHKSWLIVISSIGETAGRKSAEGGCQLLQELTQNSCTLPNSVVCEFAKQLLISMCRHNVTANRERHIEVIEKTLTLAHSHRLLCGVDTVPILESIGQVSTSLDWLPRQQDLIETLLINLQGGYENAVVFADLTDSLVQKLSVDPALLEKREQMVRNLLRLRLEIASVTFEAPQKTVSAIRQIIRRCMTEEDYRKLSARVTSLTRLAERDQLERWLNDLTEDPPALPEECQMLKDMNLVTNLGEAENTGLGRVKSLLRFRR